jgi:hypothetical protein
VVVFSRFGSHVVRKIGKFSRAYGAEHSCARKIRLPGLEPPV